MSDIDEEQKAYEDALFYLHNNLEAKSEDVFQFLHPVET